MIQLTLILKMTTKQVVETSVTVNHSPIQDYNHLKFPYYLLLDSVGICISQWTMHECLYTLYSPKFDQEVDAFL